MKQVQHQKNGDLSSKNLIERIYHVKFVDGLIVLSQSHKTMKINDISREISCEHSYASKLVAKYENYGLITTKTVGRTTRIELTPTGQKVAKHLQEQQNAITESL